jgi:hypothetical protein
MSAPLPCGGIVAESLTRERGDSTGSKEISRPAGCSKRLFGKATADEEARRYIPHFVCAVRLQDGSWRTEKTLQLLYFPRSLSSASSL